MSGSYPRWRLCPPASPYRSLSKVRKNLRQTTRFVEGFAFDKPLSSKFVEKKFVEGSLTIITSSLSRPKSRRPGTTTFEFVFYSAAAFKLDQLKSPGLSSCRSSFTTCITSSASMSPLRLCCTAPALRFLARSGQVRFITRPKST